MPIGLCTHPHRHVQVLFRIDCYTTYCNSAGDMSSLSNRQSEPVCVNHRNPHVFPETLDVYFLVLSPNSLLLNPNDYYNN